MARRDRRPAWSHLCHGDEPPAEELGQALDAVMGQLEAGMPRKVPPDVELPRGGQQVAELAPDDEGLRSHLLERSVDPQRRSRATRQGMDPSRYYSGQ